MDFYTIASATHLGDFYCHGIKPGKNLSISKVLYTYYCKLELKSMTKTLETKKRILELLKKRAMTVSELSKELKLSGATVSQHLLEMQEMDAIEKIDNLHFKKLKYYKPRDRTDYAMAKYLIGAIAIIAVIGVWYFSSTNFFGPQIIVPQNGSVPAASISSNSSFTGLSSACIRVPYQLYGTVQTYTNSTLYEVNSSGGTIQDYVIPNNSAATLNISEQLSNIDPSLPQNATEIHYAAITMVQQNQNQTLQIEISPQTFSPLQEMQNLMLKVNPQNATGTYLIRIDGPCGGGVEPFLVTIGNEPFNGTFVIRPNGMG